MKCAHCGLPKPIPCIECGSVTHHLKSKRATSGNRYQVRECDDGHTTVVTRDGQTARKYSRALEYEGISV